MSSFACALFYAAQQQLWRLIPSGDQANSMIQNYTRTANLVIDVPGGHTGKPLQMWHRKDNENQGFYIDAAIDITHRSYL